MTLTIAANLRKAAILVRSLDADTAATLLAQLSADEASAIRAGVRSLGPIDPEEQADVAAELRSAKPVTAEAPARGVEVSFSAAAIGETESDDGAHRSVKRFAFLDDAPVETLASYLAGEHAQTIAVVVSHLLPTRAAAVLAALPAKLQADTLERLAELGNTDPESLSVVERELSGWVARQPVGRRQAARSNQAIEGILAAADVATRGRILANLMHHNKRLAARLAPQWTTPPTTTSRAPAESSEPMPETRRRSRSQLFAARSPSETSPTLRSASEAPPAFRRQQTPRQTVPSFEFNDLTRLDASELAALLRDVDATVLVLALAGSSDELVDRVTEQMPKRVAKSFRRQLRGLGPTRLSDVEAAQRAVAEAAGRRFGILSPAPRSRERGAGERV